MILKMALFLSALGHDINHPGTTNDYQTQIQSKISIKYLDESSIELNSIHLLFKILMNTNIFNPITEQKENILKNLTFDEYFVLKEFVIICILRTDPRFHAHFIEMFSHHKELRRVEHSGADTLNLRQLYPDDVEQGDSSEVLILHNS